MRRSGGAQVPLVVAEGGRPTNAPPVTGKPIDVVRKPPSVTIKTSQ